MSSTFIADLIPENNIFSLNLLFFTHNVENDISISKVGD